MNGGRMADVSEDTYRDQPARCPVCAATMAIRDANGSRVDVCPACGGAWLDWFDGDPVRLARRVAAAPTVQEAKADEGRCPRCQVPLVPEEFRDAGPLIHRCGQCFGLFVPGGAVALLAAQTPERDAPHETTGSFWGSLAGILRRISE